jgi:hypothetical protein
VEKSGLRPQKVTNQGFSPSRYWVNVRLGDLVVVVFTEALVMSLKEV